MLTHYSRKKNTTFMVIIMLMGIFKIQDFIVLCFGDQSSYNCNRVIKYCNNYNEVGKLNFQLTYGIRQKVSHFSTNKSLHLSK